MKPNKRPIFRNSKGEEIKLNAQEIMFARAVQAQFAPILMANSATMGVEIDITTLTTAIKSISEQKFYQIAPADYMPVVVGEGSFSTELLKYVSYNTGGDFEEGIIHQGSSSSKLAQVDAAVEGIRLPIINWAKGLGWSIIELGTASRSGNWDLITEKEKSRKRNWDLGIQKTAFLGLSSGIDKVFGLLTQPNVNSDTTTITKPISLMTPDEYANFVAVIIGKYRSNCNATAYPTHFIIDESDYLGLGTPVSAQFPNVSKLEYLTRAFQLMLGSNFKILPLQYSNASRNTLGKNRYVLLNYTQDTLAFNIPIDYTATLANTINGMNWENAAYGQFTGCNVYRPKEVLYFDYV